MKQEIKNELEMFENKLIVYRGLREVTVNNYKRCLQIIYNKIGKISLTHEEIEEYILDMYRKKYSYTHIVNTCIAIERFTNMKGNPIKLGRPKKPRRIIKGSLSESEVSRIINITKNIREKAIVSILAFSGIRNSELCNLRVCDIDLGNNVIKIFSGKGVKDGISNISGECSKILIKYLNEFPREENEYLFTTLKNNNQYTPNDLRKLVKVVSKRAGINKRVYPHLLRHALATNMLKRGANLITIQKQLRHTFIDSTMIYLKSFPERIKTEYEFYTPAYI